MLREQLESKHIGFEMLPKSSPFDNFNLCMKLFRQAGQEEFRKNIKRMDHVVPLNEKEEGVLHKPAQLFTYDADLTTTNS